VEEAFINSAEFAVARVVALYAAINNEIDTSDLLLAALSLNKEVLYPVVAGEELLFRLVTTPTSLSPGAFGILEPAACCAEYSPSEADLVVVPGVAFDLNGRRIGYGKGYYDRALHQLEGEGRLVGFCHDFQLLDEIVEEPHDVKLDMIITEKRVVRPRDGLNLYREVQDFGN
jgi:5-formyltetrahydrofolate cyclo-ligase